MSTLLVIQAHPHTSNSLSLSVGERFIEEYKLNHPTDKIIIRDLYEDQGVPPLNDVTMEAWRKQKFNEEMTIEEKKLLKRHQEWLDEFIAADKYVFINPMYNHFVPAELKQYLDLTAVAHKTFKYTKNGPVGLLHNKKAFHIQAAGDYYHNEGKWGIIKFVIKKMFHSKNNSGSALMDLGSLYLTNMLKFYGIQDVESIYIEGADADRNNRQKILDQALIQAERKAKNY